MITTSPTHELKDLTNRVAYAYDLWCPVCSASWQIMTPAVPVGLARNEGDPVHTGVAVIFNCGRGHAWSMTIIYCRDQDRTFITCEDWVPEISQ
jgi:hypothetical protein